MLLRQEVADRDADGGRAPLPAAHDHLEADLAGRVLMHAQADVMHLHRRAVMGRAGDGDLELARQEGEFGMEGRPLPDDLAPDARILDLIGGRTGEMIGGDVADAIAAGLDAVHLDLGQLGQDIRRLLQLDPVELDVLAGGEMAVAAVVAPGDPGQAAQLGRAQRAIGDGDPQHIGMELKVEAVHQPQGLELVLADLAGDAPGDLLAELIHALGDQAAIVIVIGIHR